MSSVSHNYLKIYFRTNSNPTGNDKLTRLVIFVYNGLKFTASLESMLMLKYTKFDENRKNIFYVISFFVSNFSKIFMEFIFFIGFRSTDKNILIYQIALKSVG